MSKPRIVIDARMAGAQGHGIGNYVQLLGEGLASLGELPYEPFFLLPPDAPEKSVLRRMPHAECGISFLSPMELVSLASELERHAPALYHTTSFSSLRSYPCPHVQTVHDLNHLHFGNPLQKAYYRLLLLPSLRDAWAVFSVSETSARELRSWLLSHDCNRAVGVAPNPITPLPEADDAAVLRRFKVQKDNYFFAHSNPKPHKNLGMLKSAYEAARAQRSLPPLLLNVEGEGDKGIQYTGPLRINELGALLRNCRAFYFPSLYEGFGRPPAEAALAGAVPVVSSLAVHKEVLAGVNEAIYLDPAAEPLWRESFLRRANISARTSENSRRWILETWSVGRLAKAMDEAYRKCLDLPPA